jgi:hypothetical protein
MKIDGDRQRDQQCPDQHRDGASCPHLPLG